MTRRGSKEASRGEVDKGRREAAGDGAISRSVEATQFGDIGSV